MDEDIQQGGGQDVQAVRAELNARIDQLTALVADLRERVTTLEP